MPAAMENLASIHSFLSACPPIVVTPSPHAGYYFRDSIAPAPSFQVAGLGKLFMLDTIRISALLLAKLGGTR